MTEDEITQTYKESLDDKGDFCYQRFAKLVAEKEREEVERLKALCQEMLSELYVYRASEYLKDVTASIRARNQQ